MTCLFFRILLRRRLWPVEWLLPDGVKVSGRRVHGFFEEFEIVPPGNRAGSEAFQVRRGPLRVEKKEPSGAQDLNQPKLIGNRFRPSGALARSLKLEAVVSMPRRCQIGV